MNNEKATRLAAIRAANAAREVAGAATSAASPPPDKATRLAAIRAANAARPGQQEVAPTPPPMAAPSAPTPSTADAPLLELGMRVVLALLATTVCGLLVLTLLAIWIPLSAGVLPMLRPHSALAVSRSSSLVAYVLLWLAMAFGLALTGKVARVWPGGPLAVDLHQHLSVLSLVFTAVHVLTLLGEERLGFTLAQALLPFVPNGYRPMWMGMLGKVSLYLLTAVTLSTYLKRRIGGRWWRRLHYLSFGAYLLGLAHAIFAGSDSSAPWVIALYAVSALSLVGLGAYRLRRAAPGRAAVPRATRPPVEAGGVTPWALTLYAAGAAGLLGLGMYRARHAAPLPTQGQLQSGAVTLDPAARTVTLGEGRRVDLCLFEARVLACLMQRPGQTVTSDQIVAQVWGPGYSGESSLVRGYIRRLRAKIEPDPDQPRHIIADGERCFRFVA